MSTATLSTKGQLVIPARFRQALDLRPGDRISSSLEGEKLVLQRNAPETSYSEPLREVESAPR